ncbi:transcriptional regulator [Aeromonas enteropelogenes]|uniref:winged helix-turn-helix domain-containing protein n=1 Tax=Aeromonas enteropelogenes TaxID=29489 RepID=UPI003987D509
MSGRQHIMVYHVDVDNKRLVFGDINLSLEGLSNAELIILKNLSDAYPDAMSRERLIEVGWQDKVVSDTSLNVAINSIRKNISGQNRFNGEEIILTERGFGYKLNKNIIFEDLNNPKPHLQLAPSIDRTNQNYIDGISSNKEITDFPLLKGKGKKEIRFFYSTVLLAINIFIFIFLLYIITLFFEVYSL